MKKIALGLLLALIPIPVYLLSGYAGLDPALLTQVTNVVALNNANLMPAFLGYGIVFLGLRRSWPSETISATRVIVLGAALLTAALWLFYFQGNVMPFPLEQGVRLWVTWRLLKWCEEQSEWDWGYRLHRLRMSWYALAGATVAGIVLGAANVAMGMLWSGVSLGTGLYYTYTLYRMARMVPKT